MSYKLSLHYQVEYKINNFYMDSDVVYLSEEHKTIPRVAGFIEEDYKK